MLTSMRAGIPVYANVHANDVAVDGVAVLARGQVYRLAMEWQTKTRVRWPRRQASTALKS